MKSTHRSSGEALFILAILLPALVGPITIFVPMQGASAPAPAMARS